MNATQPPSTTTCAQCGASNAAVARFCGGCGAPLQALAPQPPGPPPQPVYPQPPYPPPPPPPQPPRMPMSMPGIGGTSAQGTIGADVQTAYALAIQGLQGAGAQITAQSPPYTATLGKTKSMIRFQGELALSALGPTQTAVRLSFKPTGLSVISMIVVSLFVMTTWGRWMGQLGALLALGIAVYSIWNMVTNTPRQLAEQMLATIPQPTSSAAGLYDARRNGMGVPPSPLAPVAPVAPSPAPAPAGGLSAGVVEQLKQLAELRSLGAVTQEEFERKKAELLRRI